MEPMHSEVKDGFLIAAIIESDAAVHAIQRELKLVYPGLVIPSQKIREILRDSVLRPEILDDDHIKAAYALLAQVNAMSAEKRRTRGTGTLPPLPGSDAEEQVTETLWNDKTQAGGGG